MVYIETQMDSLAFALSQPANSNIPMPEPAPKNLDINHSATSNTHLNKPAWAMRELRLDPFKLPQNVTHGAIKHQHMDQAKFSLTLDHDGATLYNINENGKTVEYILPTQSFKGITACAYENEDGSTTVTLELMHENPALSIPLHSSTTLDDVIADWHAWSRALNLPMYLRESDGALVRLSNDHKGLIQKPAQPRRRRSFAISHRPKFSMQRKMGITPENMDKVTKIKPLCAQDIIATL
jgi:hypothetical protein